MKARFFLEIANLLHSSMVSTHLRRTLRELPAIHLTFISRHKTTSAHYVASRPRDPTFEKLMSDYKNLLKVFSVQDLILPSPHLSLPLSYLDRLSQTLHLNRGALAFTRKFPHIFEVFYNPTEAQPYVKLTPAAYQISLQESAATGASTAYVVDRLTRLLSMSTHKCLPLRAIFRIWRELGLPDDFEDSIISKNSNVFSLCANPREHNTHILKLVLPDSVFTPAVEKWRVRELGKENLKVDKSEIRFGFKQGYPSGMKLSKDFRAQVRNWQSLRYVGPYEEIREVKRTKAGVKALEKRAVGIIHEFLSLTVEKMSEVEKVSHFRKWLGIDLNIRDLFLDHPGMFYLSTKGKRHTVFLREAYDKGCLIEQNPIYDARRKLLDLVRLGRRGLLVSDYKSGRSGDVEGDKEDEEEDSD